jgi:hypothetical protein
MSKRNGPGNGICLKGDSCIWARRWNTNKFFPVQVTCNLLGFLPQTFKTVFTATAPVFGGSGQQIYYTDVVGNIEIPSYIVNLAPLVGATQAQANVTVNLRLTNASPSTLQIYKATINNVRFPAGGAANIRIPQGSGTLPNLGPVTLGAANVAHRILLGQVTVFIALQNDAGKTVFGPLAVTCGQQDVDFIIGSVNVDNSKGAALAPRNGFVADLPATPNLFQSGAFRFPYSCDFGAVGKYPLDLEIVGTIPSYFKPGQQFNLANAQSFLRIPTNLTTLAKNAFPQATTFHTTVSEFEILFTGASPANINVASTNTIVSDAAIPANGQQLIVTIPENGSLTVGPVTAGSSGTTGISVGQAKASIDVRDASGATLLTLAATCNVPAPLELIGYVSHFVVPTSKSNHC